MNNCTSRITRARRSPFTVLAVVCAIIAALFGVCTNAAAQNFTIGFPVAGQNPYTAPIITVLDHSATHFYDQSDHSVVAYTGEMGRDQCGPSGQPCGYKNPANSQSNPVQFIVNGNYVGTTADGTSAKNVLNYRGHSGYDYGYGQGTVVVAATDGDLYVPASDPVNDPAGTVDPYCYFHTFYILSPGNGWTTWYLHTAAITVGTFGSSPHAQCSGSSALNPILAGTYGTSDTFVAHVAKGEAIATVGDWAKGHAGGVGYHLHFGVRRDCQMDLSTGRLKGCLVVDPYGWEWDTGDPITQNPTNGILCLDINTVCSTAQSAPVWNLSDLNVHLPVVTNVTLTGSFGSYTATIAGQNFSTSPPAQVTLWDQEQQYCFAASGSGPCVSGTPITIVGTPTSTQIVAELPISNPTAYALKVGNPNGPRSVAIPLGVPVPSSASPTTSSVPLILDGQPAPGGGTIVSFGGFESFNDRSEALVSAGIDTNNDGVADTFSDLLYAGRSLSTITVPPFTKISDSSVHIQRNNNGDIAFADLSSGEPVAGIWVLPNGSTTATEIIGSGQYCPSSCSVGGSQILSRLWGPLAFDDAGDVAFESGLYNVQTNSTTCCYLFAYYASTGSIVKVVAGGDPTPIGGTFSFVEDGPITTFTADGDVIFDSQISGGSSSGGIFRFSQTQGISKLAAQADSAPSTIGGTLGYPEFGHIGGVSGRQLVFTAPVIGGRANQFIGAIKDVTVSSPSVTLVAYQGEQTQTAAGGSFSYQNNSTYLPFGHYGITMPSIRSDGQVVFYSDLIGSSASTGASSGEGIFIWNGASFQKIVVDGDQASSGQTVTGVSSTAINDHGEILYFAAKVQ